MYEYGKLKKVIGNKILFRVILEQCALLQCVFAINDSYLYLERGMSKCGRKIGNVFYGWFLLLICVHAKGKVGGKGM